MNKNDEIRQMQDLTLEVNKEHIQYTPSTNEEKILQIQVNLLKKLLTLLKNNIKFGIYQNREEKEYDLNDYSISNLREIIKNLFTGRATMYFDEDAPQSYKLSIISAFEDIRTLK